VFTVRYALSAYIKQIRLVFKGLNDIEAMPSRHMVNCVYGSTHF
jgi:hypothetical protein